VLLANDRRALFVIDMEQQGSAAVTDSVDRAGIRFLEMREEASGFGGGRGVPSLEEGVRRLVGIPGRTS